MKVVKSILSSVLCAPFPGLPAELKVIILLWLNGKSLPNCRQVSSSWNQFTRREVWARQLERRLRLQWRHAQLSKVNFFQILPKKFNISLLINFC